MALVFWRGPERRVSISGSLWTTHPCNPRCERRRRTVAGYTACLHRRGRKLIAATRRPDAAAAEGPRSLYELQPLSELSESDLHVCGTPRGPLYGGRHLGAYRYSMDAIRTLDRRQLITRGNWITVEEHRVQFPDGRVIEDWTWVVVPSYVTVVALTTDRHVVCFRQLKYALEGRVLALIAGYLEPGEDPLAGAKRELAEEAGMAADEWTSLGRYVVDSNRGVGVAHLFLATNATTVSHAASDDLEEQELVLLPVNEFKDEVLAGAFGSLSWGAAGALALLHLGEA